MKFDNKNVYYGAGKQMQTFPLFKGVREKYSCEVITDTDFNNDLVILDNPEFVKGYLQAYNIKPGSHFNKTNFDINKISELLFDKMNKCTKCKTNESLDWLKCDGEDKVGLYFIIHNFIYVYILSSARDVSLNL
jgi:hypothetical protein